MKTDKLTKKSLNAWALKCDELANKLEIGTISIKRAAEIRRIGNLKCRVLNTKDNLGKTEKKKK